MESCQFSCFHEINRCFNVWNKNAVYSKTEILIWMQAEKRFAFIGRDWLDCKVSKDWNWTVKKISLFAVNSTKLVSSLIYKPSDPLQIYSIIDSVVECSKKYIFLNLSNESDINILPELQETLKRFREGLLTMKVGYELYQNELYQKGLSHSIDNSLGNVNDLLSIVENCSRLINFRVIDDRENGLFDRCNNQIVNIVLEKTRIYTEAIPGGDINVSQISEFLQYVILFNEQLSRFQTMRFNVNLSKNEMQRFRFNSRAIDLLNFYIYELKFKIEVFESFPFRSVEEVGEIDFNFQNFQLPIEYEKFLSGKSFESIVGSNQEISTSHELFNDQKFKINGNINLLTDFEISDDEINIEEINDFMSSREKIPEIVEYIFPY